MGAGRRHTRFQSTPPRRRRRVFPAKVSTGNDDFNPRLREGGDEIRVRGPRSKKDFNPRLREGGDHGQQWQKRAVMISIHASAKEATLCSLMRKKGMTISIHASAKEATNSTMISVNGFAFQSTPPRRRRLRLSLRSFSRPNFNPRLREGGDKCKGFRQCRGLRFQSTPPRRRRP